MGLILVTVAIVGALVPVPRERTARQIDHLPVSGPDGSLVRLSRLPSRHRVYTHINNTNPMLLEDGPERALVEQAGLRIGVDGMRFTL